MAAPPPFAPRRGWSLRTRLLFLSAIVPLPLVALLVWGLVRERADALEGARAAVLRRARHVSDQQRRLLERSQSLAAVLANVPAVRRSDWTEVGHVLFAVVHRFPEYQNVRITDVAGAPLSSARPLDRAAAPADLGYIDDAVRTGSYTMSGPFTWSADGRAVADVAYPIRRHGGATAGIVVMTIDLAELAKVPDEAMTPGAALTVVGQHGTVIARTPSDGVALGTAVDADLLARLRGGPGEGFVESDRLDGVPSMIGYQRLPLSPAGPPLIVAVSLPRHVVVAPVVEQSGILAFGVCVVVGLVLGVGTAGSRALVAAPVSALLAVQERMAGGELAARTADSLLRDSSEFGQLARGLAALGDHLQVRDVEQATAEGRLRAILDGYPGFAALVSRDLRVEEFNAALLDELHVTRAEVVGQPVSGFGRVSGPSTARAVVRIREALEGRGSREIIEASLPRSGVRLVDASFTPVAGPSGRIDHVAVFGIDVTDAKATEQALEASRLELAEIFEGAPIALGYVTVMEDGGFRLASVNPAFTRFFPLPALPSDGVCLGRLQPEAFRESLLARCREAVDRRTVVSWDESLVRDTGARHLHLSLSPLVDASGACTRLIGSVQDVTAEHRAAEAVREYAARMALIFNTSSDMQMLHRVDEHFTIEAVNHALLATARRRPGPDVDPVGMHRDEYLAALGFPPDAIARSRDKLRQAVDERARLSYPVEVYLADAQGGPQTFRLQVTVSPHAGDDGVCTHVLWSAHDVTAEWRAERSLRESEERLLEAQRLAHVGSWEVDLQSGARHWSHEVFRILEIAEGHEPPTRAQFLAVVHPDDRDRVEAAFAEAVQRGTRYSVTHRVCLPDGRTKVVEQQAEITYGHDGTPLLARGTMQDLTERMLVAEALRASEANLRQAELLAGFGHYQAEDDGEHPQCSDGFKRLFGFGPADTPSRAELGARLHPADREACRQAFDLARTSGQPFDCTYRVSLPDGTERALHARGEFRPDALDGRTRFFAAAVDVTDIKEAERRLAELNETLELRVAQRTRDLESSNRELESFSYSVSHDLRAPLRAIDGFTQAAIEAEAPRLSSDGLALLRRVQAAAQRMGTLIDALLRLSQMYREPLRAVPVDLTALARSIAEDLVQANPARQPEVVVADGLTTVGDPRQLRVALTNLLDNAFKFSARASRPRVEVGARQLGGREVFFVRDNGVGFDMDRVGKLFQPFERLHSPLEYPGTGIGLATVQRVAQRHGGSVWAESAPGRGATFYLVLDASADDWSPAA